MTMLDLALRYVDDGWAVLPLRIDKTPYLPEGEHKKYLYQAATEEEVRDFWQRFPTANIGLACGKVSGRTVVDFDGGDDSKFPETLTVQTPSGGTHRFYEYCEGIQTGTNRLPGIDIRNDGGYVVAAGSTCEYEKKGKRIKGVYRVITPGRVVPFPLALFPSKEKGEWKKSVLSPIQPGGRNSTFTSIIGGLLQRFPVDDWDTIVWQSALNTNKAQTTPLSDEELRTVFNSISQAELKKRNTGGDIKDVITTDEDGDLRVEVRLEKSIASFKVKNITASLLEANLIAWLKKSEGLSHEINFYLKVKSDTNKEQLSRVLSKAFDNPENKEKYPWTLIVNKLYAEVEKKVRDRKQDFTLDEITAKPATWMHEPFIQEGQINTFFGLGSSGKTMLSLYFATLVKGKTLLIDYENDDGSFKDKALSLSELAQEKFVYFDSEQVPVAEQVDKLKSVIKKHDISLVIVDSASLASGETTSDESAAIRLLSALKKLKITCILIAHQRKTDGDKTPIGSIQFENQSRNVWNFKGALDMIDERVIHVACKHTKCNNSFLRREPIAFKVTFSGQKVSVEPENPAEYHEDRMSLVKRIENHLFENEGQTLKDLAGALGADENSIKTTLYRGQNKGTFENREGRWFYTPN